MMAVTIILLSVLIHLFTNTLQELSPADQTPAIIPNITDNPLKARDYYIAAVVEYSGVSPTNKTGIQIAKENAQKHADIIKKASEQGQEIDIIVFPELGILNFDHSVYIEVPDPKEKIIPATNETSHEVLKIVSQAAIDQKVYVVVNLHELYKNDKKEYKYNTNVVFDRNGAVIARYRKYNLFGEFYLNRTNTPEYVNFTTDFGVNFGTFICFDIIFEQPAIGLIKYYGITDFVYSTAWFSELPFHVAIQEQYSWAYANDVNLLASGYNNITLGNTGSGIYAGKKGAVVYEQTENEGSRILIGKVPKKSSLQDKTGQPLEKGTIIEFDTLITNLKAPVLKEDINPFKNKLITPETMNTNITKKINVNENITGLEKQYELNETLCYNEFCCKFSLLFTAKYYQDKYDINNDASFKKPDAFYHYRYRMIAYDGIRNYIVGNTSGEQLCAIMPCLNDSLNSCSKVNYEQLKPSIYINDTNLGRLMLYSTEFNKIQISGDFHNKRVLYLPSVLISSPNDNVNNSFGDILSPDQFQFNITNNTDKSHIDLSIMNDTEFASGGILARLFEKDNKPINLGNSLYSFSLIWCLIPVISYLLFSH